MSKIMQSKREAKRLLKLAQETESKLDIPNLSTAQKIIAYTNGFKNWHDFEVNLNRENPEMNEVTVHKYLIPELIYELKSLYVDEQVFNPSEYDINYQYKFSDNLNKDKKLQNIGYITEKTLFSEKQKEIKYYKKNHMISGSAGSGKSEVLRFVMEDCSSESCVYFSSYEGVNLYQKLSMSKKPIMNDMYYCSLLPNNKTTHSIDLINPLIELEVGFKKSFALENELLNNIFYQLAFYYKGLNKALDSKDLQTFLSLKWLSTFNDKKDIENLIDKYFNEMNISRELIKNENFFNLCYLQIQEHHKNCYITQIILSEMSHYENKGVFSKESQINFVELLENNKHLIFDVHTGKPGNNETNHKELIRFIYMNYFHVLKNRDKFLSDNIHENINTGWGFSAVSIIEDLSIFLNDKMYTILNDILQSRKNPVFLSEQSLVNIKPQYHSLLNHINYYLFLKSEFNTDCLIPEMCKNMLMQGKNGFKNIARHILDVKELKLGESFYWTDSHEIEYQKGVWKTKYFDLLRVKLKYSSMNYHNNQNNKQLINYPVMKKIKI